MCVCVRVCVCVWYNTASMNRREGVLESDPMRSFLTHVWFLQFESHSKSVGRRWDSACVYVGAG